MPKELTLLDVVNRMDERFTKMDVRFDKIDERFTKMDERFDGIDKRLDAMDGRLDRMESDHAEFVAHVNDFITDTERHFARIDATMVTKDYLDDKLADMRGEFISSGFRSIRGQA